ncbi:MAG: hypothetical protein ACNA8W_05660 [Bradymonadaceae bacterium]
MTMNTARTRFEMDARLQVVDSDSDGNLVIEVGYSALDLTQWIWTASFYEVSEGREDHSIDDAVAMKLREISSCTGWVVRIRLAEFTIEEMEWRDGREPFTTAYPKLQSAVVIDVRHDLDRYIRLGQPLANPPIAENIDGN